jgi:excinuclease ABC subunit C
MGSTDKFQDKSQDRSQENLREKAAKLPHSPGVYLMKDKTGRIIYVGKAKILKTRVSSYFAEKSDRDRKTAKLIEHIRDFDYIVVPKEIDAFVLETTLIKQHNPKYNILLKDAKGFNYVKISGGDYPRISYVMSAADNTAKYLGPYVGGYFVKQSVEDANRIFMLPSCSRQFRKAEKSCLNYRIKRCMGVCRGNISREEYAAVIEAAVDYIKNGSKESVRRLTAEMHAASDSLEFEKAAKLRDRIAAMKRIDTVQSVISSKLTDYDVVGLACDNMTAGTVVRFAGGRLVDKQSFLLGDYYDEVLGDFLREYYSEGQAPREVYIERDIEDRELTEQLLQTKIVIPKRGEGLAQVMLAKSNAAEFLAMKIGRKSREVATLEEVARLLGLAKTPRYIECCDISNIGEGVKVGAVVVYKDGKPLKSAYRRYTVREVAGTDDYACMREVIRRRFTRAATSCEAEDRCNVSLLLVDGGAGHVSAVQSVLDELGVDIPLFGLVKDGKHKTRAVASSGGEIEIQANKGVFTFLTKIQEEVHRFAVTFAREKHRKSSFALTLTQVSGIGEAKAAALLTAFKTKDALKAATVEELRAVAKIGGEKAAELMRFIETI